MDVTPVVTTSGGDSLLLEIKGKDVDSSSELKHDHDFTQKSVTFESELKLPHKSKYYDKPFAVGSIVMTMNGPTRILGICEDGE